MKTDFVKETDKKGRTYIIEGEKKPKQVFNVKRFVCEVQRQKTEEETEELADLLVEKLSGRGYLLSEKEMDLFSTKLRSISLFMSAHPENEENSEMADWLSDVLEMEEIIQQKRNALPF